VELDAHTAMLTLCVFLFISFPFGVATASTIRVGNLLGAGLGQQVGCSAPAVCVVLRVLTNNDN
jgi:multidrug resistance protein, MATE family